MQSILAWPKTVWLAGRRINHFLIAKFDENRAVYCFVWFPITQFGLLLLLYLGLSLPLSHGGSVALFFLVPVYVVFYFPFAGLFFLSLTLFALAYMGVFSKLDWPLFSSSERLLSDFVSMFRDTKEPPTRPTSRQL